MRHRVLSVIALLTVALISPLAAQAHRGIDGRIKLQLEAPVNFVTADDCPAGAATYNVAFRKQLGSGMNCILEEDPADCPPGVTAQFCQNVPIHLTVSFDNGTIEADGAIFEAWNCDVNCAVDQRWSGTVSQATRKFRDLVGASVSGGGLFEFDATTFDLVVFNERLVIDPEG